MLSLSGVSTTTGALQVAQGVLAFSGDGAWPSASEVVLKGGELVIDDLARLPRETSYKFLGGKLTIASGVQLVSRSAVVANGAQGETVSLDVGVYTKENLPSFIQGDGSLRVKGDGLVILIR
jgi:autotransporter-associated beta strand protein